MRKVLYIRFVILLYIFLGMFVFCCPVFSDTFDDDFIKNKKLETSIDLKSGSELNNTIPEKQESSDNVTDKVVSVEANSKSLPPVSDDNKSMQTNTQDSFVDNPTQNNGVPKPLYNDKKQVLQPDDFYDNLVLDTTSTKLPRGNQNNLFLLGLVSIVVVITSIFLLVNFLRTQKDLDKQREFFHKNFDPLNVRQGFFSADYDLRNTKTDGIEIVKNQTSEDIHSSSDNDNIGELTEKYDSIDSEQENIESNQIVESSSEVAVSEEFINPVQDELSYQLKEANKVFEENIIPEVVGDASNKVETPDSFSDCDLDFIDEINSNSSNAGEIDVDQEELSCCEILSQEDNSADVIGFSSESDDIQTIESENNLSEQENDCFDSNNYFESEVFDTNVDTSINKELEENVEEVFDLQQDDEILFAQQEPIQTVNDDLSFLAQSDDKIPEDEEIFPVQDIVLEQEQSEVIAINENEDEFFDDISSEKIELQDDGQTQSVDDNSFVSEPKEEKIVEDEKTEEQNALEKFEVVDGYKLNENKEVLLIKEGIRYSFMVRIYTEVFKLFDMSQPDKINRVKEIDEKQDDKQVYMIKGDHHRILFAMNDKEANFIMEL